MGQNEVKLIISANNTGAITGVKGVTDSLGGLSNKVGSLTSMFRAHWLELSALTAGVYFSVKKIYNEFAAAAERQEKRLAFTNLAASFGANADSIIADLKRMSGQSVTSFDIMQRAGKAMLSGLDPKALPGLMEFSKTLTKITGEDVGDTFSNLTRAIITGQDRMLRMQGITVDFDKAQQDLAASLGGTKDQLNEQQIQYANLTALLESATKMTNRMGKDTITMSDDYQALATTIAESSTRIKDSIFAAFGPVGREVLRGFAENLRWINWWIDSVKGGINYIVESYQKVKSFISGPSTGEAMDFTNKGKGITSAKDLGFTFENTEAQSSAALGPGLQSLAAYMAELKASFGELADSEKDLAKEANDQIKDRAQAYHNMYEALKFDTEKYYTYQKGLLEKQFNEEIAITGDLMLAWEAYHARLQELEEARIMRSNDFAGGIKVYYAELKREGFTWAKGAKGMMEDFASGATSSLSTLAKNVETDFGNIGSHVKTFALDMSSAFLDAINRMIAEWLVFMAMQGIKSMLGIGLSALSAGAGATGGTSTTAGSWGLPSGSANPSPFALPKFHSGGLSADEVPAILQRGEYVINRRAVAAVGRQNLDNINRGNAGSGGHTYHVTVPITNQFIDATGIEKYNSLQERQVERAIKKLRKENKLR